MVLTSYLGILNILQIKFSFLCRNGFETSLEINNENKRKNNKHVCVYLLHSRPANMSSALVRQLRDREIGIGKKSTKQITPYYYTFGYDWHQK
jgi:hypothetical protein